VASLTFDYLGAIVGQRIIYIGNTVQYVGLSENAILKIIILIKCKLDHKLDNVIIVMLGAYIRKMLNNAL